MSADAVMTGDHRHHHSAYRAIVEAEGIPKLRGSEQESVSPVKHKRHSNIENLNHKIVVHGHKFDMDPYKPPAKVPGLENVMEKIRQIEDEEEADVRKEQDVIKKVEEEYLNSDLHKEALTLKLVDEGFDENSAV